LVDAYAVNKDYDAVLPDNFAGAYAAVTYLIKKNHRHIGMLGGCQSIYPGLRERRRGYEQALQDHGISDTYLTRCTLQPDEATKATRELLETNPHVTAIFGCNDEVSIAAIHAARKVGRKVPEHLSVIGFDDIEFARYVTPPLTTMRIDKVMIGRKAVQLLLWRMRNPNAAHVTITVHSPLIERASVVPCRETSNSLSKLKAKG
jgi:LacI family transcriptional regulator